MKFCRRYKQYFFVIFFCSDLILIIGVVHRILFNLLNVFSLVYSSGGLHPVVGDEVNQLVPAHAARNHHPTCKIAAASPV